MPWLTIIMTILSFLVTRSKTGSTSKAALAAALVGGGTYALTHSEFAAGTQLAEFDGVVPDAVPLLNPDGTPATDNAGNPVVVPSGVTQDLTGKLISETGGVLKSWGGVGTAAVVGTAALAGSSNLSKYLPLALIAGAVILLSR